MDNNQLKKYIGLQIKEKRETMGIKQEHMAQILKLSRTSIHNIESGRHSVTAENIMLLCGFFNCTPNELFPPVKAIKYIIEEKEVMVKKKKKILKIIK